MHREPASFRPLRLGPRDQAACRQLDLDAMDGLWSEAQWRAELEDSTRLVLGWRQGDSLVALACGQAIVDDFHVSAIAIHPHWRRRGLARRLLTELLEQARRGGCRRATLEVESDNTAALALYGRLGFETRGVRRAYYRSGGDALIQWCNL